MYAVVRTNNQTLAHHGIKGQKWGVKNGPPYPLASNSTFSSPSHMMLFMKNNIKYSEFTKLKSPKEVADSKSGSCHDQVMFELDALKKMGKNPKAKFLIEIDDEGNGGSTHSFVYYEEAGNVYYVENAFENNRGIHKYKSIDQIVNKVGNEFRTSEKYNRVYVSDFVPEHHKIGEDLQELVFKCLDDNAEELFTDELAHHGIKGQKWGVKNGPPYPLPEEKASKVRMNSQYSFHKERHFTKKELASSKYQGPEELSKLKRITKHDNVNSILQNVCSDIRQWDIYNCQNCSVAFDMIRRGYNVKAKPRREGSNVGDVEKFYEGAKLEKVGVSNSDPLIKKLQDAYKLPTKLYSEASDFYGANFDEIKNNPDGDIAKQSHQNFQKAWEAWDEVGDIDAELFNKAYSSAYNKIESFGPNSRGTIVVGWQSIEDYSEPTNEFHAFNFERVDGNILFYDTQSYRKSTGVNFLDEIVGGMDPRELYVMRTDDKELSDKFSEAVY